MKQSEILKKQVQLLEEVDFLADNFTQNERNNLISPVQKIMNSTSK